jgi:VCBS repeat-containing protein
VAGSGGESAGHLSGPQGVAVSGSGDLYVTDTGNNRISEFSKAGAFVRAFGKDVGGSGVDVCTSSCVAGTQGGDAGQLGNPVAVVVSGSGDVYVADTLNDRVSEFTQAGVFVQAFGKDVGGSGVDVCTSSCVAGSGGGDAGELEGPTGIGLAGSGDVYVTERFNDRVSEFTQAGVFVRAFGKDVGGSGVDVCTSSCVAGSGGGNSGQLALPVGLGVSGSGDVYVGDGNNRRVDEFSQAGAFVRAFGKDVGGNGVDVCTGSCRPGSFGGNAGQITSPAGVGVSGSGAVYVADFGEDRVAEFGLSNAAPVAVSDAYSTNEDTALTVSTASGVLANDSDGDNDPLTAVAYTDPQHGVLTHNADGSFSYTPDSNFHGQDSFTYRANDGTSDSSPATVTITVNQVNTGNPGNPGNPVDHPPVAVGDAAKLRENSGATTISVLANDTDTDGGPKSVAALTQPAHGTAAITSGGADVTYTPARGYCNTGKGGVPDTFSYTLNGGSQATVAVTVSCAPLPRLTIGHRAAHTTRTATSIRLTCKVARCQGTLSLQATSLGTRIQHAKASRSAHFNLRAGTTKLIRVQTPAASRKQLATRHRAVARAVAHLRNRPTVKRLVTLAIH